MLTSQHPPASSSQCCLDVVCRDPLVVVWSFQYIAVCLDISALNHIQNRAGLTVDVVWNCHPLFCISDQNSSKIKIDNKKWKLLDLILTFYVRQNLMPDVKILMADVNV